MKNYENLPIILKFSFENFQKKKTKISSFISAKVRIFFQTNVLP